MSRLAQIGLLVLGVDGLADAAQALLQRGPGAGQIQPDEAVGVLHEHVPALQQHPHGIIVCDEDATAELKVGTYKYFKDIEGKNLDPDTQL